MSGAFDRLATRRGHLAFENSLRALTVVIDGIPGGINLGQGTCDLDTPGPLQKGAMGSIDGDDRQTYTHHSGLPGLRSAIADKLQRHNGIDIGDDQVMVAAGASGAFSAAVFTLLEPGDEVIVFEPFYAYHPSTLRLADAVPVSVPLEPRTFALDPDRLRAAITDRTRAILVNTPANPSGKVFEQADLHAVADAVEGTDIVVITDEPYEYMTFDGRRHVSPATVEGLGDRTLTIGSFSKTYSITGWRIGYLAGPADMVASCGRVFDQLSVCAARPLQRGVERALRELPDEFYTELRDDYERKRDRMCEALATAGFSFAPPEGAYYVLADHRQVFGDVDSEAAVRTMIERIGINAVPGGVFYEDPTRSRDIRFHFAVTDEVLDEVCGRLVTLA